MCEPASVCLGQVLQGIDVKEREQLGSNRLIVFPDAIHARIAIKLITLRVRWRWHCAIRATPACGERM